MHPEFEYFDIYCTSKTIERCGMQWTACEYLWSGVLSGKKMSTQVRKRDQEDSVGWILSAERACLWTELGQ